MLRTDERTSILQSDAAPLATEKAGDVFVPIQKKCYATFETFIDRRKKGTQKINSP